MIKVPRWIWTLLLLLVLPAVMALLVLSQPSTGDYVARSRALAASGDVDEAIAVLNAVLTLEPENPLLYVERGQRILLLYEWDRALADFDRALALDAAYADAYHARGLLYASVPDASARPNAIADFEHYLQLEPQGVYAEDVRRYIAQLRSSLGE
jgi:regulator of sirC expression with transglutaminase-like and TPR domain